MKISETTTQVYSSFMFFFPSLTGHAISDCTQTLGEAGQPAHMFFNGIHDCETFSEKQFFD